MFPVRADPYNVVTEFCVLDVESSYNAILERPCIHIMRAVLSTHQLLRYPTPIGMVDIREQAMARTIAVVARKKSRWITKTSQGVSNKDPPVDKEQK